MATFSNVIQPDFEDIFRKDHPMKGSWNRDFFTKHQPLVLELGCGKGEYTIGLAERYPDVNFVGIDLKGARFWRGAKTALEDNLKNVAFVRTQIELVNYIFGENEIEEIWITFPDPQIKFKRTKHRMTNPQFLNLYQKILKPEGIINLKTDSEFMHGYTLGLLEGLGYEVLYSHHDIYVNHEAPKDVVEIQTFYEKKYLENKKPITYLKFRFKPN